MEVLLIRHAETYRNKNKQFMYNDAAFTLRGMQQCQEVANFLKENFYSDEKLKNLLKLRFYKGNFSSIYILKII